MLTNRTCLELTLRQAHDLWVREQRCQSKNAVNEGAWSIQVVEPVLAALGWQRLLRSELKTGTGAFFEWPGKHEVDVALLDQGTPRAFLELKDKHLGSSSCFHDLQKKLARYPALRVARHAVTAWFAGAAGFGVYAIMPKGDLGPGKSSELSASVECLAVLSPIAHPVVMQDCSTEEWLDAPTTHTVSIAPRLHPRVVQRRFYELLSSRLNLERIPDLRFRCKSSEPPSPTYAYADLPGVLPRECGIVFDFDNTMNQLQCFFYRRSNRKRDDIRCFSAFDSTGISDLVLELFIADHVLPAINRHRASIDK